MGAWAVVTGASGGLGREYARYLAGCGLNIGLVARNRTALESLSSELCSRWGVETAVWRTDLADPDDRALLIELMSALEINTLVNNAGYGLIGEIGDLDPRLHSEMVAVNCVALTELTRAVLPGMLNRAQGSIINVASTAAFQAIPGMSTYAASKAYVLSFTEGLWAETSGTGVRAIAICPGPTDTAFFEVAGDDMVFARRRTPVQVVRTTFAGLQAGKPYVVDGNTNRVLAAMAHIIPARLSLRIAQLSLSI